MLPTGIANYLAIPHAKLNIKEPLAAVAVNDSLIDFNDDQNLGSRIIIMLLSPSADNEIQLRLLSEIASKFSDKEKINKLLQIKEKDMFLKELQLV